MRFETFLAHLSTNHGSNHSTPLNKMATRAINNKGFKQLPLLNRCTDFEIISQKCSLANPNPK